MGDWRQAKKPPLWWVRLGVAHSVHLCNMRATKGRPYGSTVVRFNIDERVKYLSKQFARHRRGMAQS